ncbi:MAG: hypothetical protein ACE5R4_08635 [Armatimonadota bacterium]
MDLLRGRDRDEHEAEQPPQPTENTKPAAPKRTFEWKRPSELLGGRLRGSDPDQDAADESPEPNRMSTPRWGTWGQRDREPDDTEATPKRTWRDLISPPKAHTEPLEPESSPKPQWRDLLKPKGEQPALKQGEEPDSPGRSSWRELLNNRWQGRQEDEPDEAGKPAEPRWKSWFEGRDDTEEDEGKPRWRFGDPEWKQPEGAPGADPEPKDRRWGSWPDQGFQPKGGPQGLLERWRNLRGDDGGEPDESPDELPWWRPGSTAKWPEWAGNLGDRQKRQRDWYENTSSRWANWWEGEDRHGWWNRGVPTRPRWHDDPPEHPRVGHHHGHHGKCDCYWRTWPGRFYWRPWRHSHIHYSYWYPYHHCRYYYGDYFYYPWYYDTGFTLIVDLVDYDRDYYYEPIYYQDDYATVHYEQEYGYDDDYPYYPEGTSQALGDALRDIALSWLAEDPELLARHLSDTRPIEARDEERGYERVFEAADLLDLITLSQENIETERFYFTDVDESEIDGAWAEARHLYREDGRDKEAYVHYHLVREYGEWYVDAIMVKSEQG